MVFYTVKWSKEKANGLVQQQTVYIFAWHEIVRQTAKNTNRNQNGTIYVWSDVKMWRQ